MTSSKVTGGPLVDWSSVISIDYIDWLCSGNSDFLEDAVEETFLCGFNGRPRFHFGSTPFSWLYRTLRNICCEMNRGQSKFRAGDTELDI